MDESGRRCQAGAGFIVSLASRELLLESGVVMAGTNPTLFNLFDVVPGGTIGNARRLHSKTGLEGRNTRLKAFIH